MKQLDVSYQSQNDNKSGTGYRECFSSTCAMIAMYHERVFNDDEYNSVRTRFGDSTDPMAQESTLRYLGLNPTFVTDCCVDTLKYSIDGGNPVGVGWLHKGPSYAPTGFGHWSLVIGYTDSGVIMHDPNGDPDLKNGGYLPSLDGEALHFSYKNWRPRWEFPNSGDGWAMFCDK